MCMMLTASMIIMPAAGIPDTAYADSTDGSEQVSIIDGDDGSQGSDADITGEWDADTDTAKPAPEQEAADIDELSGAEGTASEEPTAQDEVDAEQEDAEADDEDIIRLPEESASISRSLAKTDSDELLENYIESEVAESVDPAQAAITNKNTRGSKLTGNDRIVYDELRTRIEEIAAGGSSSSVITISLKKYIGEGPVYYAKDLGYTTLITKQGTIVKAASDKIKKSFSFDNSKVINALLTDLPYEFYWFDKTVPYYYGLNIVSNGACIYFKDRNPTLTFRLCVSADYSVTGWPGTQDIDTSLTGSASAAASKAADIINDYSDYNDLGKLTAYKNKICALTSYNTGAGTDSNYGDPWQLIYVFDGDPTTNVVCEGYAKAFQFLCDMSSFSSSATESRLVTGTLASQGRKELHMWNIIHMADGRNYLADITNCDTGTIGNPGKLFMTTAVGGSLDAGFNYQCGSMIVKYTVDSDTRSIYSDSELDMYSAPITFSSISARTYTGSAIKPALTVTQDGKALALNTDYTVTYSSNKNVGTAKAVFTGKGNYEGMTRTLTFKINPKGRSISKLTRAKKAFTVKWSKLATKMSKSRITGYQIEYSTDKDFKTGVKKVTVKGYTKKSRKITKLKAKTTYYVRMRTYMKVSGTTYYSNWSAAKSVKTK